MDSKSNYLHPTIYMKDLKEPILTESDISTISKTKNNINSIANSNLIENLSRALRSNSSYVYCPFCSHQGLTKTSKNLNILNLLFFIFTVTLGWLIWKFCRAKDLNCYNVKHNCFKCDTKLASYNAC